MIFLFGPNIVATTVCKDSCRALLRVLLKRSSNCDVNVLRDHAVFLVLLIDFGQLILELHAFIPFFGLHDGAK
jgi:hypothetical protein